MKTILAAFTLAMNNLREKANLALKDKPPVDQFEAAREVSYAFNTLQFAHDEVERMLKQVDEMEKKLEPEIAAAASKLIADKVAAGELLEKSIVDAAVAAAETRGRDLAAAEFAKEKKEIEEIAARRQELAGKHGEKIAAALKDDALKGDAFAATSAELDRRIVTLKDHGVTLEKNADTVAQVACGHAFDDTGKAAFDSGISIMQSLSGSAPARKPGSGQPPAQGAAERAAASKEEESKPSFIGAF